MSSSHPTPGPGRGPDEPGASSTPVAHTPQDPTVSSENSLSGQDGFDESDIVVKANQLIRGRINWTKLEHRVVAMLVAQLKRDDESFKMQRVHISELMDMAQISSRDIYDRAEEVCRKLLNQKVQVRTHTEDGRRVYQGYNCLSMCRYVEGSGYIEAKFNDDMKPFLLQLKRQFTMYRLRNFMQLSSQHSMRMYELIKMKEGLRYLCISVEELREVLCCEHTYERFSDFKRYVLERARTEIREVCDVYFTYRVEREGRTPKQVHFLIHQKDADGAVPSLVRRGGAAGENGQGPAAGDKPVGRNGNGQLGGSSHGTVPPEAAPRFDLFATVLAGLTQEELNDVDDAAIRSAIRTASREVETVHPESAPPSVAREVATTALSKLNASLREKPPGDQ